MDKLYSQHFEGYECHVCRRRLNTWEEVEEHWEEEDDEDDDDGGLLATDPWGRMGYAF